MLNAQQRIFAEVRNPHKEPHDFNIFFNTHADKLLEVLIKPLGDYCQEKCTNYSVVNMLKIKSLLVSVGISLSLIYAQIYEGQKPKPSDSRDQHNAISASMTDIFVTNDSTLKKLINRIPENTLTIMNLTEFINCLS